MADTKSGKWGCLSAVVAGGVGLTLVGLGFDSHTTEAMPFGAVLLLVGVIIGVPSLQALRGAVGARVRPFPRLLMFALLTFCVGLGLVGLGVQPRTTEALPFGVVTALVGLVLAVVSLVRGRTVEEVQLARGDPVIAAALAPQTPTSVRCENCGSPAPLRLATRRMPRARTAAPGLRCRLRSPRR